MEKEGGRWKEQGRPEVSSDFCEVWKRVRRQEARAVTPTFSPFHCGWHALLSEHSQEHVRLAGSERVRGS